MLFVKRLEKVSKDAGNGIVHVPKGHENEVESLLRQVQMSSLSQLVHEVQQVEETIFSIFHKIQDQNQELEILEVENKQLENKLNCQVN